MAKKAYRKVYKAKNREWRWRVIAPNGRKVANSGEGYQRKGAAIKALGKFVQWVTESELVIEDSTK